MSRRALLISLFVSLAVNIFVVGAFIGAAVIGPHDHGRGRQAGGRGGMGGPMGPAAAVLAPEHRESWRAAVREQALAAAPKLRQSREVRRDAWLGLAKEPMDAQAVLAELGRSRTLEAQARADIDRRVVEFAGALPAEERARLAQALVQPRRGPGSGGRRPAGEGQPGLPDR